MLVFLFFFSSRRRHTRYIGDWSSDVCSSDLGSGQLQLRVGAPVRRHNERASRGRRRSTRDRRRLLLQHAATSSEIGRASWREREYIAGVEYEWQERIAEALVRDTKRPHSKGR